jgi:hypothetical protein
MHHGFVARKALECLTLVGQVGVAVAAHGIKVGREIDVANAVAVIDKFAYDRATRLAASARDDDSHVPLT